MFTQTFRFAIHYTLTVSITIQPKDESGTVVSPIWLKIIPTQLLSLKNGEFSVMKILESGMVVSPIWLKIIPTRFVRNSPKLQFLNLPMLGRDFLSSEFVFYISLIYI